MNNIREKYVRRMFVAGFTLGPICAVAMGVFLGKSIELTRTGSVTLTKENIIEMSDHGRLYYISKNDLNNLQLKLGIGLAAITLTLIVFAKIKIDEIWDTSNANAANQSLKGRM